MNNEEKILAMLTQIQADQQQMCDDITGLKVGQSAVQKSITTMQDDITAIKVRLDYDVDKRFDAVNEGIDAILAQLTPKRKVEEMDADIVVLKAAVKMLTQEVAELKKAK